MAATRLPTCSAARASRVRPGGADADTCLRAPFSILGWLVIRRRNQQQGEKGCSRTRFRVCVGQVIGTQG